MIFIILLLLISLTSGQFQDNETEAMMCIKSRKLASSLCQIKPRRYDISDLGHTTHFHGWADVQGQGMANDYCRIVGNPPNLWLSCALAGTHGCSDTNYNSAKVGFDVGHKDTWYMRDEDNDGKDDYCRCVSQNILPQVMCTKAGPNGFYGSMEQNGPQYTFTMQFGTESCENFKIRPEFGREYIIQ